MSQRFVNVSEGAQRRCATYWLKAKVGASICWGEVRPLPFPTGGHLEDSSTEKRRFFRGDWWWLVEDVGRRPRKLDSKCYLVCDLWWETVVWRFLSGFFWRSEGAWDSFWKKLESVMQVVVVNIIVIMYLYISMPKVPKPSELSAQSSPNHWAVGVHWILQPEVGEASWHQFFLVTVKSKICNLQCNRIPHVDFYVQPKAGLQK